jgi:hypothetical protein
MLRDRVVRKKHLQLCDENRIGTYRHIVVFIPGAPPNFSLGWGVGGGSADPEAIYTLCLILKIML